MVTSTWMKSGLSSKDGMNKMSKETIDISSLRLEDGEFEEAMKRALLINPDKISAPIESFVESARKMEQNNNRLLARVNYETAGRLALKKGDAEAVRWLFLKSAELEVDDHLQKLFKILSSRSQEAVDIARKYYETNPKSSA